MRTFAWLIWALFALNPLRAQTASVSEAEIPVPTYGFSDPDPVPMLATQPELYPYHKFSTYASTSRQTSWKVVTLENEYLKVEILPQVGGKIWGITEKKTGYDIIYKNETLKFRNIATRGPWTSGGIEFNFGFFGHTPYAATPVSYSAYTTSVGDAVCVLGASDLPSRSDWRVKIILPAGKAWVKIECAWTNTTPYCHPYYYWTNAAVRTADDLKFDYPGHTEIGHGGDAHPYPIDPEGRDLSLYRNNAFGNNKSYHVLGDNKPFKAVYRNDKGVGVGSMAEKTDILGKKLWLWSQAPAGAVWEELLTDHDGQYIEIQSGRMYSQASPESGLHTPYTQYELTPYQSDYWCEYWYPVIGTGGVTEASREGIIYIDKSTAGKVKVNLMALEPLNSTLAVVSSNNRRYEKEISLAPTGLLSFEFPVAGGEHYKLSVSGTGLYHDSQDPLASTHRPVERTELTTGAKDSDFIIAEENFKYRRYGFATAHYENWLKDNPTSLKALTRMAEICMRTNRKDSAAHYLVQALETDTYDGHANFLYGVLRAEAGDYNTAEEAFAIASRNTALKVAAYIEIARINLVNKKHTRCMDICKEALLYDARNLNTLKILALAGKASGQKEEYRQALARIREIDPLDYFAAIEETVSTDRRPIREIPACIAQNEYPGQLLAELAIYYYKLGFLDEAISIFKTDTGNPLSLYWLAWLDRDNAAEYLRQADIAEIGFVFPHREETFPALEFASSLSASWKVRYYQALLHWKWNRMEIAKGLFDSCGNNASSVLYLVRGIFGENNGLKEKAEEDFRKYLSLNKADWRAYYYLVKHLRESGKLVEALSLVRTAAKRFEGQFILRYDYAGLLLMKGKYKDALRVLKDIVVLPAEHTGSAYPLYYSANMLQGLDEIRKGKPASAIQWFEAAKEWPGNLGGGFGYEKDFSLQNLLIDYCSDRNGRIDLERLIMQLEDKATDKMLREWIDRHKTELLSNQK